MQGNTRVEALATVIQHLFTEVLQRLVMCWDFNRPHAFTLYTTRAPIGSVPPRRHTLQINKVDASPHVLPARVCDAGRSERRGNDHLAAGLPSPAAQRQPVIRASLRSSC